MSLNGENSLPAALKSWLDNFEPSGVTRNREIPMASSIIDYIFGWLERRFLNREKKVA